MLEKLCKIHSLQYSDVGPFEMNTWYYTDHTQRKTFLAQKNYNKRLVNKPLADLTRKPARSNKRSKIMGKYLSAQFMGH